MALSCDWLFFQAVSAMECIAKKTSALKSDLKVPDIFCLTFSFLPPLSLLLSKCWYNSSEGVIRILKVKTKVSGGFRTQAGADQYACFHSILATAKRSGESKFGTLYQLMIEDNPDSSFIEAITS